MDKTTYNKQLDSVVIRWCRRKLLAEEEVHRNFSVCCANLMHFRPQTRIADMPAIFRGVAIRQVLTALDLGCPELQQVVRITGWDEAWLDRLQQRPGIIITYHTGTYRLLCRLLAEAGISVALLLSSDVLETQGAAFTAVYKEAAARHPQARLRLLDAGNPTSLLAMARAAKAGMQLLVYIDGNTGAAERPANLASIRFLRASMQVRRGVAAFAIRSGLPVYTVYSTRPGWRHIHWEWETVTGAADGHTDCRCYTECLFSPLGRLLDREPQEWEGWLYWHTPGEENGGLSPGRTNMWLDGLFPFAVNGRTYAISAYTLQGNAVNQWEYQTLLRKQRQSLRFGALDAKAYI